jgi:hypothetical protein
MSPESPLERNTPPQQKRLSLRLLNTRLSICRLGPSEPIPDWAWSRGEFTSVTRTADELSVVCAESAVPPGTQCETGWRIFQIEGPLESALTGILVSVAKPLADAGVAIFAVSSYDTDYVMVKEASVKKSVSALTAAGHIVKPA